MMRPDVLTGQTHKFKIMTADGEFSFYVTVNFSDGKPFEVFVNSRNARYAEHMAALTVMVSRMLQRGFELKEIANDLLLIHSPETGHLARGGFVPSLHARIGKVLLESLNKDEVHHDAASV